MYKEIMMEIKTIIMESAFYLLRVFPIKRNKIVCSSFLGKGYGDNGKAIIEELLKDGNKYDIVWLNDPSVNSDDIFPSYVRAVPIRSLKAVYEQVTAKVWIDNRRKPLYVRKRNGQFYMVTNHGNNGLKRVEFDVKETLTKRYIRAAMHDSKMADVFLSSSKFDTWCFRSAYKFNGEILERGYPRQDILFGNNQEKKKTIKKNLGIPDKKRLVLYAPTFRQALGETDLNLYSLDWVRVLDALTTSFGDQWGGLVRLHPNISQLSSGLNLPNDIIDVTNYPDFDELILISDVVITDYSSSIIEAGISNKIGLFFAVDMDDYKKERNFYIPLEAWPFPLATSNDELVDIILNFNLEDYKTKSKIFFEETYNLFKPGRASFYAAERIREEIYKG